MCDPFKFVRTVSQDCVARPASTFGSFCIYYYGNRYDFILPKSTSIGGVYIVSGTLQLEAPLEGTGCLSGAFFHASQTGNP